MKKILLAFDGEHYSPDILEFVKEMNAGEPVLAVGLFLPAVQYAELVYSIGGVPNGPVYVGEVVAGDETLVEKNIATFREACTEAGISCHVRREPTREIVGLLHEETRFADLLVLSSNTFYESIGEDNREDYIENVLHKAECPVVLIPGAYNVPRNIILVYDGSEQSVFAIKQFSYLFPRFKDLNVLLVYLAGNGKEMPVQNEALELLRSHYKHLSMTQLNLVNGKDIEKWILTNNDPMLVAGAYGKRMLSEIFRKDIITDIVRNHKTPVFVAHK